MSDLNAESRSSRLDAALHALLAATPELEAAAVVSLDGLPMASALPAGMDEDRVAAMSAALLSLGERAAQGLGRGELSQVYVEGEDGTVFLVSAEDTAVLVAVAARGAKIGMMLYEVKRSAADVAAVLRPAPVTHVVGVHPAPAAGAASYAAPTYAAPTYDTPAYSAPSYAAPSYAAPSYDTATPAAPTYDTPAYSASTYSAPAPGTPRYDAPVAGASAYAPVHAQPVPAHDGAAAGSGVPAPSAPSASESLWSTAASAAPGVPGDPQAWA